jgi:putative transposase
VKIESRSPGLARRVPVSLPETEWLKEALLQPLQPSLKDRKRGYKNFFQKHAAFPRFKKRVQNSSLTHY